MGNNKVVRGYKIFLPDWTCRPEGGFKQYSCPGEFEEDVELEICGKGMHFCKRLIDCFNYRSFDPRNKVAEVEAYGIVIEKGNKCCTNKLRVIRELSWHEVLELVNTGEYCTGRNNSGNWNTGNLNTGYKNTGICNSGDYNVGEGNGGDYNTGCYNTGDGNTGDDNVGCSNTGERNLGDNNTGDWNLSSGNTGCFMTEEQKIPMFNKPSDWTYDDWLVSYARCILKNMPRNTTKWVYSNKMTDEEKLEHPEYEIMDGYLAKIENVENKRNKWWKGLTYWQRGIVMSLPNFDKHIFKEITGIDIGG